VQVQYKQHILRGRFLALSVYAYFNFVIFVQRLVSGHVMPLTEAFYLCFVRFLIYKS